MAVCSLLRSGRPSRAGSTLLKMRPRRQGGMVQLTHAATAAAQRPHRIRPKHPGSVAVAMPRRFLVRNEADFTRRMRLLNCLSRAEAADSAEEIAETKESWVDA